MTSAYKRIGLGFGAAALTVLMIGAGHQNINAQGGPAFNAAGQGPGPGGPGGPGRRGGPGGPGGFGPMLLERLNLTTDQRDRVKQIRESHREEQQALRTRAMQAHQALQGAVTSPTFDESAVRTRAAEVATVDADVAVAEARIYAEVYQILTSEQQEQLKTMQANMQQRLQQRQQNRPPQ